MIRKFVSIPVLFLLTLSPTFSSEQIAYYDFPKDGHLTEDMIHFYDHNGFLILNDYLTAEESDQLVTEGGQLISDFAQNPEAIEIFSADTAESAVKKGQYFIDSANKISFFLEDGAFINGEQVVPTTQAINKIAHALGELNESFRAVTFRPSICKIVELLGIKDPRLNQSMMICKPQNIGGEVKPHQDSTFIYTEPNTTTAFWMPLEDTTTENACLYAIPGSHQWPLLTRYVKKTEGFGFVNMKGEDLAMPQLIDLMQSWPEDAYVPLPMKKGSLIIFPGHLVHRSGPNLSNHSRNAYTFHVISGESTYPTNNWLQRSTFRSLKEIT